jgi:hypothetical protein
MPLTGLGRSASVSAETLAHPADRAGAGLPRFRERAPMRQAVRSPGGHAGRRSRVTADRVTGRNLGQDDPDAVGVLDVHLDQAPGFRSWLPHNRDSVRGQPGMLAMNIADLDPDHHRGPGPAACPATSSCPWSGKNTSPGSSGRAELPANRQAQQVTVEAAAAVQVAEGAAGSGCSERPRHHSSITLSDTGGLTRTRTLPPD